MTGLPAGPACSGAGGTPRIPFPRPSTGGFEREVYVVPRLGRRTRIGEPFGGFPDFDRSSIPLPRLPNAQPDVQQFAFAQDPRGPRAGITPFVFTRTSADRFGHPCARFCRNSPPKCRGLVAKASEVVSKVLKFARYMKRKRVRARTRLLVGAVPARSTLADRPDAPQSLSA